MGAKLGLSQQRLRVFEKRVLRRICGSKRVEDIMEKVPQ
jgi:hypothetical protein